MLRHLTIATIGLLLATAAYPCSGKYLGRSGIGMAATVQPARILVLGGEAGKDSKILTMTLRQIGHSVRHVTGADELLDILSAGEEYDIVLVGVNDAASLATKVAGAAPETRFATFGRDLQADDQAAPDGYTMIDLRGKSTQLRDQIQDLLTFTPEESS